MGLEMKKVIYALLVCLLITPGKVRADTSVCRDNERCRCIERYISKKAPQKETVEFMTHYLKNAGEKAAEDFFGQTNGMPGHYLQRAESYCNIALRAEHPEKAAGYYTDTIIGILENTETLFSNKESYEELNTDILKLLGVIDEYMNILVEPYTALGKDGYLYFTVRAYIPKETCHDVFANINKRPDLCRAANYCDKNGISIVSRKKTAQIGIATAAGN